MGVHFETFSGLSDAKTFQVEEHAHSRELKQLEGGAG